MRDNPATCNVLRPFICVLLNAYHYVQGFPFSFGGLKNVKEECGVAPEDGGRGSGDPEVKPKYGGDDDGNDDGGGGSAGGGSADSSSVPPADAEGAVAAIDNDGGAVPLVPLTPAELAFGEGLQRGSEVELEWYAETTTFFRCKITKRWEYRGIEKFAVEFIPQNGEAVEICHGMFLHEQLALRQLVEPGTHLKW